MGVGVGKFMKEICNNMKEYLIGSKFEADNMTESRHLPRLKNS